MKTKLPPIVTRGVRILLDYVVTKSELIRDRHRGLAPRQPRLPVRISKLSGMLSEQTNPVMSPLTRPASLLLPGPRTVRRKRRKAKERPQVLIGTNCMIWTFTEPQP